MTVQFNPNSVEYIADGILTSFSFDFRADDDSWVTLSFVANLNSINRNPDQEANPGGTVDYTVAPPNGTTITVSRSVPRDQLLDLTRYGPFDSESLELSLDKLTMIVQDVQAGLIDDSQIESIVTQAFIGRTLYPVVPGGPEETAGITPTNYQYEPGNVLRYGTNTTPGTTDMLTAINNAVSVANQAGGGFVDITTPEVYSVSTGITWKSNVHLRICEGASIKLADGAADLIRLIDARGGLSNIGFYGPGRIDANAAGQTAGNRSHGLAIVATNVIIKDLEICNTDTSGGSLGDGVILEPTIPDDGTQCENVRIENCYIHDTGRVGITLESGLDVRITGCRIEDAGTSAIDLEPAGGTIGDIDGVIVSDCHVKNCSNGIHAVSETTPTSLKNIVFVNNILDNITDHGYQLRGCNNVSISGGRIIDPGTNGIYIFADNSTDADEIDIKDVHISGTPDYGVRAQRIGSGTFSRVSISGVTVDGSTVNSMLIEAVTELNLSGCKANYTTGDGFKVNLCTDAEVVGNTAVETAGIPASDGFRATNCTNLTLGSNTALGTDVGIALQSNTKIVWRGGDNFDEAATTTFSNLGSNTGWYGRFAGSFTAANAVSTNVSSAFVETYSDVFFTPTNAAAGTLQAGANALYHNQAADSANTSFRVTTAAGGSAAGTETYNYLIVNENR